MASPDSGTSTSTVVSAVAAMSSSVWPTPTVSMRMRSKPNPSSTSVTSSVVVARPPWAPRVAMDLMNTPGSRLTDSMRMRSPSSAPPVKGLVGSTAMTATLRPRSRYARTSCSVSVLFPAPGGPVIPVRCAPPRPSRPCSCDSTSSKPGRWFSTRLIARARAAVSPRSKLTSRSCARMLSKDKHLQQQDRAEAEQQTEPAHVGECRDEDRGCDRGIDAEARERERDERARQAGDDQIAHHGEKDDQAENPAIPERHRHEGHHHAVRHAVDRADQHFFSDHLPRPALGKQSQGQAP